MSSVDRPDSFARSISTASTDIPSHLDGLEDNGVGYSPSLTESPSNLSSPSPSLRQSQIDRQAKEKRGKLGNRDVTDLKSCDRYISCYNGGQIGSVVLGILTCWLFILPIFWAKPTWHPAVALWKLMADQKDHAYREIKELTKGTESEEAYLLGISILNTRGVNAIGKLIEVPVSVDLLTDGHIDKAKVFGQFARDFNDLGNARMTLKINKKVYDNEKPNPQAILEEIMKLGAIDETEALKIMAQLSQVLFVEPNTEIQTDLMNARIGAISSTGQSVSHLQETRNLPKDIIELQINKKSRKISGRTTLTVRTYDDMNNNRFGKRMDSIIERDLTNNYAHISWSLPS